MMMIPGEIMNGGLLVGTHSQSELLLIRPTNHPTISTKQAKEAVEEAEFRNACQICGDEVGLTAEGEAFVGCHECAFPICRTCYQYERAEGAQVCPKCNTRLKRLKGCARVDGDEEEEDQEEEEDDMETKLTILDQHSNKLLLTDGQHEPSEWPSNVQQDPDPYIKAHLAVHSYGSVSWKGKMKACKGAEKEPAAFEDKDDADVRLIDEARLPLSRKVQLPSIQINPYRMIIYIRLIVLVFFFHYRITNPVNNARALWLVSVICELWFALSWILDQFLKWHPINRETYLDRLSLRYDEAELPAVDLFVSTVDPVEEPPLALANTILSILAVDYPPDKVTCYVSDDGAVMLTFEALSETSQFATKWVPFCHKFNIEPRAPESYFNHKLDYLNYQVLPSFVKERRAMKREYEEFKVRINALVSKSRRVPEQGRIMQDGTPWPGNDAKDHPGMIQVFFGQNAGEESKGSKLPHLVYVSRERRPGFNHHKKAGAMNALVRVSGLFTNAPYVLNLDWDQYINNSKALREAMCFMLEPLAEKRVGFVQFPQSLDRDTNTTHFDIHMKGLDGIQGPMYAGTGSILRRRALYGQRAPERRKIPFSCSGFCCIGWGKRRKKQNQLKSEKTKEQGGSLFHKFLSKRKTKKQNKLKSKKTKEQEDEVVTSEKDMEKKYGTSPIFAMSTLLQDGGTLTDATSLLKEAIHVIGCCYEEKTEWGKKIGWIYGSPREDILTSLKLHCHGWRSIYHVPDRPVFKKCAKIEMTDHLLKVLQWGMSSIQIFLSKHCPVWHGFREELKFMERVAYINATIYPFTSLPLLAYSTLPAVCLLSGKFIVADVNDVQGLWFVALLMCFIGTAILEMRWSCISMDEWWRNEQFWMIRSISVHVFAVFLGLIKVVTGVDLTKFGWDLRTAVMVIPTSLLIVTIAAILAGLADAVKIGYGSWGPFLGKLFFALWLIVHLYPFLKGLFSRRNRAPGIVIIWSIMGASAFSYLCIKFRPLIVSSSTDPELVECGLDCNV